MEILSIFRWQKIDIISYFQVLYFVDDNGNEVLSLGSMVKVSEETIRNILCRESLSADEFVKFQVKPSMTNIYKIIIFLKGRTDVVQKQL